MASLDSLPPDQRAVLQLVLQRGRSYDEIAKMLSIDRAGVRERALQAFDALGPTTRVPAERRALITDYLLGQLPPRVADDTRDRLGESASERAWARVIASELSGLTDGRSLPEIPVESGAGRAREPVAARNAAPEPAAEEEFDDDEGPEPDEPPRRGRQEPLVAAQSVRRRRPQDRAGGPKAGEPRPSSRRGGAIVLGVIGAVLIAVIVVVVLVTSSSSSSSSKQNASVTTTTTANAHSSATTSTSASGSATPIAQIKLTSPTGTPTTGLAIFVRQGSTVGVVIRAAKVPPNTKHDAYAVWLNNSRRAQATCSGS